MDVIINYIHFIFILIWREGTRILFIGKQNASWVFYKKKLKSIS